VCKGVLIYVFIVEMPAQPRTPKQIEEARKEANQHGRTAEEIEEVRKAHRVGYLAKHPPPPKPPKPLFGVARELKPKPFKPYPNTSSEDYKKEEDPVLVYRQRMQAQHARGAVSLGLRHGYFAENSIHEAVLQRQPYRHIKDYEFSSNTEKKIRGFLSKNYRRNYPPPATPPVTQSSKSPFYRDKPIEDKKRKRGIGAGHGGVRKKQRRS